MSEPTASRAVRVRCAIYTRKSSDEGLEQEFNSLHAQRDAGEAYIRSQAHENWRALPEVYDDGGHSGGSLERPALKRLLDAVRARRIDVIVIYKIDRLTRSLPDFARLAELFDAHNVSFVSVTQQFNTTTSMGRLMLNVLLSFAQFEREITAERIRDKIAASKKKGMWMGGNTPIGYVVRDRALVIDPERSETVRAIFQLYLDAGTVAALQRTLDERGIRTVGRRSADGRSTGALPFSRGHLYRLLQNPIYVGCIAHKRKSYPGLHKAIIDASIWERTQVQLALNTQGMRRPHVKRSTGPGMLIGLLVDEGGRKFSLSHASKRGKRYHYYVCSSEKEHNVIDGHVATIRLPALEIESVVKQALTAFLVAPARLGEAARAFSASEMQIVASTSSSFGKESANDPELSLRQLRPTLTHIIVKQDELRFEIDRQSLRQLLHLAETLTPSASDTYQFAAPISVHTRGKQIKLVIQGGGPPVQDCEPNAPLLRALVRARRWFELLTSGEADSIATIAKAERLTGAYVARVLKLTFLAPAIVEQILDGRQALELSADRLTLKLDIPMAWRNQTPFFEAQRLRTLKPRADYA